MNNFALSEVGKLTVPLLVSLILGLIANLLIWARDFSRTARRTRALDEETKKVAYWRAWHELQNNSIDADLEGVYRRELRMSASIVAKLYNPSSPVWTREDFRRYRDNLPAWRRILLVYKMPTRGLKTRQRWFFIAATTLGLFVISDFALHGRRTSGLVALMIFASGSIALQSVIKLRELFWVEHGDKWNV